MASSNTSSPVTVVTHMDYNESDGPSQPQYRILNRMSTLFGGKKKNSANNNNGSSSSTAIIENEDINPSSQVDSMFNEERNASCVDSMYSSLQSRRSNYRPSANPNTPAPLRTVQLDNPIVHLPTPSPPPVVSEPQPSTPTPTPTPPILETRKSTPPPGTSSQKIEDVEAQFKLLLVNDEKL